MSRALCEHKNKSIHIQRKGQKKINKILAICFQKIIHLNNKQMDSMLLCVCSVTDHRRLQNVVKTKKVAHKQILGKCVPDVLTTF